MNNWIEWSGGEMPVDGKRDVDYKLKSGLVSQNNAGSLYWGRSGSHYDIVAYRLSEQQGESIE